MGIWLTKAMLASGAAMACVVCAVPAMAQQRTFDVPAQSAAKGIPEFARQASIQIIAAGSKLRGKRTSAVKGQMDVRTALQILIAGTGLRVATDNGATIVLAEGNGAATESASALPDEDRTDSDIVVTGSRIRGAAPSSPVIVVSSETMRETGQSTLGDVARNLPQSFSGGQNPNVTIGALGVGNENVSSASTLNLRGLGSDATLTLLNGHRLAYDSIVQGIDISAIPVAALDRLEIVADGASAIYGSDAVGGVANIILRKDYAGFSATARIGGSTDGGNFQRQLSAVSGARWASGGVIATVDYQRYSPILAKQRPYTSGLNGEQMLFPDIEQWNAVLSGHQQLGDGVELSLDGTYSNRHATRANALGTIDPPWVRGSVSRTVTKSWSVSPRLKFDLIPGWQTAVSGTYAEDNTNLHNTSYRAGLVSQHVSGPYANTLKSVEVSGEGSLVTVSGRVVRLAVGAGYRSNTLTASLLIETPTQAYRLTDFSKDRNSYYAFGELLIPLIIAGDSDLIHRAEITGAVRYERYPGMAELATPKVGLMVAPTADFTVKSSWGKSFKAPTLYQQHRFQEAILFNASMYGAGYPATATTVARYGGNSELRPETATSWTAGVEIHPRAVSGLRLEVSYFNIKYRNRIVEPIQISSGIFTDPAYQSLITFNPTNEQINAAAMAAIQGLQAGTTTPYDPAGVVAIVDNRYVNLASQNIEGVDLSAEYVIETGSLGRISATGNASYLRSQQRVVFNQPSTELAGTIFDPPHWRGRGGLTWNRSAITVNASMNYIGELVDDRRVPNVSVGSMTTTDFTIRFVGQAGSFLSGWDISATLQNAFNVEPRRIRASAVQVPPYDSTNHSAIGRYAGLSLTKSW